MVWYLQITIIMVLLLSIFLMLYISYQTYLELGWNLVREQGAEKCKRKMIQRYHMFILFLKLNSFFFLGLMAQYTISIYFASKTQENIKIVSWIVTSFICIMVIVYYIFGYLGAQRSSCKSMGIFIAIAACNFLGLVYILVEAHAIQSSKFRPTIIWLTSFVCVQIITNAITLYIALMLLIDIRNGIFKPIPLQKIDTSRSVRFTAD